MIIPGIIAAQGLSLTEQYISSEPYPAFNRDSIACSAVMSGAFTLNTSPTIEDELTASASMAGTNTLLQVVVEHTLDTDELNASGEIAGTNNLTSVIEQTLDTDELNVEGSITGTKNLTSIIEHTVFDTDNINVAGSISGTHTLV